MTHTLKSVATACLMAVAITLASAPIASAQKPESDKGAVEAKIKAIFMEVEAAHRSGDVDTLAKFVSHEYDWFPAKGSKLEQSTVGVHKEKMKAAFAAGLRFEWEVQELNVKLYGDSAVTTCLFKGQMTSPGGSIQKGTWRNSNVWTKLDGNWKIVHSHVSPLIEDTSAHGQNK